MLLKNILDIQFFLHFPSGLKIFFGAAEFVKIPLFPQNLFLPALTARGRKSPSGEVALPESTPFPLQHHPVDHRR